LYWIGSRATLFFGLAVIPKRNSISLLCGFSVDASGSVYEEPVGFINSGLPRHRYWANNRTYLENRLTLSEISRYETLFLYYSGTRRFFALLRKRQGAEGSTLTRLTNKKSYYWWPGQIFRQLYTKMSFSLLPASVQKP